MKFKKRYYIFAIAFYFIAVITYVLYQYIITKNDLYSHIDSQLQTAALSVPQVLSNGYHDRHLTSDTVSSAADMENILRLSQQSKLLGVKFIYSLIQYQDQILFTSCSSNPKEFNTHTEVHYFDPYDDAPDGVKKAFLTGEVQYDEYTDQWGTFRSIFIPLHSPKSSLRYVLGADVDITYVQNRLNEALYDSLIEIIYHMAILLPIFLLYRRHMRQINADLELTIDDRTQKLQKSETKFREMFSRHSAPMLLINPDTGKITEANKASTLYYGYPYETLITMNINQINTLSEDEILRYRQNALNESTNTFIFNHKLANGDIRIVEVHSAPILNGDEINLFSIIFDITEQKQMQSILIEAKKVAEDSAKAKSEFLATMSHEIRTPMNGVLGMLSLLEHSKLDPNQRHQLSVAKGSATSLLGLINDILDFSKIEAGKMDLEILPFDLKKELNEFTEMIAFKAEEKGLNLTLDTTQIDHSAIMADPGRVRQILTNLVGNAIKFTAKGSIQILARLKHNHDASARLIIEVIDSGIGIPTDKLQTLFDPFTQADGSTTRKYGGTGLGLSIVKQLCRLMNGTVRVSSIPGEGSTFCIDIEVKLTTDEMIPVPQEIFEDGISHSPIQWPARTRILLVEDNPTNQIVAQGILDELGLSADIAGNGIEALEALKLSMGILPYTIVLMDCQMPEMDGYEATQAIRNGKAGHSSKTIPIIAMTANAMQGDKERCIASGMDDYLAKPIDLSSLKSMLIKWLSPSFQETKPPEVTEENVQPDKSPIWDKAGALERLGGKEKFLTLVIKSFLDESPKIMEMLETALSQTDIPNIQLHAHSIKGSAANIGATLLQEKAKAVEFGAKEGNLEAIHTLFPELKMIYQETIPLLQQG